MSPCILTTATWPRYRRHFVLRRARRVVVGAGGIPQPGWVETDIATLDVTEAAHFRQFWRPGTREAFMAEHVWEHLTPLQAAEANTNCHRFLRQGGWLRLAVPDGYRPDPEYLERVRPGGTGPGAEDHHVLYNYQTLADSLQEAGFKVRLLEYFDEQGTFHEASWDPGRGMIRRSRRFDPRNQDGHVRYTSLIVDAMKVR